ncbi:MAG TPA: zinc ABC transporter substrate-binding protein [Candidatus Saccharimonadales bacterium]|nr:zinc ABC transporter substrate-binding protein [Candidatus Saccharimonadales bacterium]
MKKRYVLGVLSLLFVAAIMALAVRGVHQPMDNDSTIAVVAGENVWGDIVRQIGGSKVRVTSIMNDPSADPHLYESNAHDAVAVARAKLVIVNGLGYDDFLTKLLAASPQSGRRVVNVAKILHKANGANPHLWYDIPEMQQVAQAFEEQLAEQDHADSAYFAANLDQFEQSLDPLLATIAQIKTRYLGASVAYTERVPGYLLADAGLSIQTPSGFAASIEDGNDPSLADQTTMEGLITGRHIRVLLYNVQASTPITQRLRMLAATAHVPVVGVSETMPKDEPSYQRWQQDQLTALRTALQS